MTERTWVTFTSADQARPGRRMRSNEHASHMWTVEKSRRLQGHAYIFFNGVVGALEIAWIKRQRWQIEV